jgi:hypothetical protein
VDPRADLDDFEKRKFLTLPGLELRPLSRPARSQPLYELRYHGSYIHVVCDIKIKFLWCVTPYNLVDSVCTAQGR